MSERALVTVPGASVLLHRGEPDKIRWPNGMVTEMRYWPLLDLDHYRSYQREPVRVQAQPRDKS